MTVNQHMIDHINWSVFWFSAKKQRYVRKRFHDDLPAALTFFQTKAKATLHSDNVGFPPPRKITHHEVTKYKVVKVKGKRYRKKYIVVRNLMEQYNQKGIWWCAHCIALRRFTLTQTERGPEMFCPVCGCSNYLHSIRRYNPQASVIEQHKIQRRTSGRRKRSRR